MMERAMFQFTEQVQRITDRQQRSAQVMRQRADDERIERDRRAVENVTAARTKLALQQRAEATARQAAADEETRRETAWLNFYRKPAWCDDPPSIEALVQCANQHIRAKRSFEAAYKPGDSRQNLNDGN